MNEALPEALPAVVEAVESRFGLQRADFRNEVWLIVPPEQIVAVCRALRDEFGFERLSGLTAVDYWPEQEPRFHVVYHVHSLRHNLRLGLRVPVSNLNPSVPTLEGIYPSANWHEREVWDMFGIHFEGHSDLRRILMPADWEGHPLRKDYPLGYEEVQFTFNVEEVNKRKPRPQE
jgi:NADH-quinone oxidoreductase subunit C